MGVRDLLLSPTPMTSRRPEEVIAHYTFLRRKFAELEREMDRVDAELLRLERLLPDEYVYPGDEIDGRAAAFLSDEASPPCSRDDDASSRDE
jgi:hypothetical protein